MIEKTTKIVCDICKDVTRLEGFDFAFVSTLCISTASTDTEKFDVCDQCVALLERSMRDGKLKQFFNVTYKNKK